MPRAAMWPLAARLAQRGFAPHVFAYQGRRPLEANVEHLARFAAGLRRAAYYVGHSLGGVLVLETLNRHPELEPAGAVLLGAPVRGCFAARRLSRAGVGRWMLGAGAPQWAVEHTARWERQSPLGVIAGTLPFGLGHALGAIPGANDGVVRVEETAVEGMSARVLVRRGHSALIASGRVAALTARFLDTGSFQ